MRRLSRYLLIAALAFVAMLGICVAGVWLSLDTDAGRAWLGQRIAQAMSGPGSKISIGTIEGALPFHPRIASLTVADDGGTWLTVRSLALDLTPAALLERRLDITRLEAGEISVLRKPNGSPASGGAPSFAIPQLPFAVSLHALRVPRLALAEPLLGQAVVLGVSANATLAHRRLELSTAIDRLDGAPGQARVSLSYGAAAGATEHLDLAITANDPSGLVVKALDPAAGTQPLDLSIQGGGPIDAWRGTFTATAGREAKVNGTLSLDRDKTGLAIGSDASATLESLIPERFRPVIGKDVALAFRVRVPDRGPATIESLDARTNAGSLALHGDLDVLSRQLNLSLQGDVALAPFSELVGSKLGGRATIDATVDGFAADTHLSGRLTTRDLRIAGSEVDSSETRFTVAGTSLAALHGFVSGEISGFPTLSPSLPRRLADDLLWSAEIAGGAGDALIEIRRARIDDSVLHADLSGQYGIRGGEAVVRITADDLAPLATASNTALHGRAMLTTELTLRPDGGLRADARASGTSIHLGIPALDALIGGRLDLVAAIARDKNGVLTLSDIIATAAQLRASGKARLDPAGSRIVADGSLTVPRLTALSQVLGMPVTGSAAATGSVSGSLRAPQLDLRLETKGLRVRDRPVDRAVLTASTAPSPSKSMAIRLDLAASGLSEIATTTLMWREPERVDLSDIVLTGTAVQGSGSFLYDTTSRRVSGALTGGIDDLGHWSGLLNTAFSGQADLALTATAAAGQSLAGKLRLRDLGIGRRQSRTSLQDATIDVALSDLLARPQGRVSARLSGGRAGSFSLKSGHFEASRGSGSDIRVAAGVDGAFREPVTLEARGTVSSLDRETRFVLVSLDGRLGSQTIQLRQALNLTRRGGGFTIAGLDLAIGAGRVTASGNADSAQGRITVAARNIDLELLARLFGQDEISGVLGADGVVSGPWTRPDGRFTLAVPALKLAAASHPELPALAAKFAMTLRNEALALDGRLETLGHESISVTGAVPLRIDPRGATLFTYPGQIRLMVAGEGRLEDVAAILPLGEDQIGGSFKIDLAVGGTMAAPSAEGAVSVSEGRYDNLATGVSLRNLGLELVGNQSSLELRRLDANDADKGHLTGSGRIALNGENGPELDLALTMTRFVVTRLDTANVTASGNATIAGSLSMPRITGRFGIDRADIQIPDKLPSQIPTVAVIRINSLHPRPEKQPPVVPTVEIGLDLTITAPGNIFISGQGLTSEWQGKVTATGTSDAPNLVGRITSIRGTYAVLGKTFTLQRGVIGFAGGGSLDPTLDIQAERMATDITARVAIAGTASAPGLTLSSTPALPQDEILSRVLFGTGVGQISPIQALQLAQTAAAFTGNAPDVMSKVRSIVGLDQLTLDSDTTGTNKTAFGNTTINGGKYIAPGVFVGVQKGLTPSATKGQLQVTITPHVSFEGAIGAGSSSSSLGLAYRRDY